MSGRPSKRHYYRLCEGKDCTANLSDPDRRFCTNCLSRLAREERQAVKERNRPKKMQAPDWTGAACAESDPELFFPADRETSQQKLIREHDARRICQHCPIVERCFEYAWKNKAVGVWGGKSDEQRDEMRRQERNAARRIDKGA